MNEKDLLSRIERNPDIMMGKPVVKGTRLPVDIIVEKLAYGLSFQDIIREYPFISEEDIRAALLYAAKSVGMEEVYSL